VVHFAPYWVVHFTPYWVVHFHRNRQFVFIFQTTKDGNFRGANSFQHDVDVVIEVPEKGKAVQMGRFNQGGEIGVW
jgi:predicted ATP-dependent serine protease